MRDAVAEVLSERRALVPRRSPSVVVSLLIHFGIAALILVGSRRDSLQPAPQVLNIRLAPPPVTAAPPPVVEAPTAPAPAPAPVEQAKPEKAAEKKTPKKPVEKALFGKSTQKPSPPVPSREARALTPPPAAAPPAPAGPGTGIAGLEGGDFPYTIYIERMLTLIGSNWLRPQSQREVITQVYFVIERDGRVRDVKVEKESGIASFDRAALRAVMESSPLPPLPFGYSGTYLGVHLTFH